MLTWLYSGTVSVLSMLTVLTSKCQLSRLKLLLLSFFFINQKSVLVSNGGWGGGGGMEERDQPFNGQYSLTDRKKPLITKNL